MRIGKYIFLKFFCKNFRNSEISFVHVVAFKKNNYGHCYLKKVKKWPVEFLCMQKNMHENLTLMISHNQLNINSNGHRNLHYVKVQIL